MESVCLWTSWLNKYHQIASAWIGFTSPRLDSKIERAKFHCYCVHWTFLRTHIPWGLGDGKWRSTGGSTYGRDGFNVGTFLFFLFSQVSWLKSLSAMHLLALVEVHLMNTWFLSPSWCRLFPAVFPVVTGMVLSLKGASAFTFVTVPLAAFMAILWGLFPSRASGRSSSVWRRLVTQQGYRLWTIWFTGQTGHR